MHLIVLKCGANLERVSPRPSFGLKTSQMGLGYEEIQRLWLQADQLPIFEHAWLWDHMVPLRGDVRGATLEAWTLLAALAAQTERLRLGVIVTSNRLRPPAVLAKMAATLDHVAGGRLIFGIGAGGHLVADPAGTALVRREHEAYGLPLVSAGEAVGALGETLAIVRRMWSEDEPFDFAGRHYQLQGAICEPKPVQRPGPPILLAACGERVALRLAAEHASLWICPTGDVEEFKRKSELLDQHCRALGRDPSKIGRLQQFIVSLDHAASTVSQMRAFAAAGCTHLVIAPRPPLPSAQELVERIVEPVLAG